MKKSLIKIFITVLILVVGYQQFCYADVISTRDMVVPSIYLIGIIGVGVLIVLAISLFTLKATMRKQNESEIDENNKANDIKFQKEETRIKRNMKIWGVIVIIAAVIAIFTFDSYYHSRYDVKENKKELMLTQ